MQNVHFSPAQAATYMGVNESTIKRWVDKGFIEAVTTPGGHRRIARGSLEKFLKQHKKFQGNSYIARRLHDSLPKHAGDMYYRFLYERKYDAARDMLTRAYLAGTPMERIFSESVVPALQHIGHAWIAGEIDIADEHRMSFMTRTHLAILEQLIPSVPDHAPLILLSCTPQENHELPLVLIALVAKSLGMRVETIGINVPAETLIAEIKRVQPAVIGLSHIYKKQPLPKEYCSQIGKAIKKHGAMLLAGGNGWLEEDIKTLRKTGVSFAHVVSMSDFVEKVKGLRDT